MSRIKGIRFRAPGGTAPAAASTFTVALSSASGAVGTTQTATVAPGGGGWPSGQIIALTVSGVACAVSPDSRNGVGSTPVAFSFTPSAAGTLVVNATAQGMTSTGAKTYTVSATSTPIVPTTPTQNANRYELLLDQSAVSPGDTVTGKLVPNGLNAGGDITLTRSSGPTSTITLPSSGSAVVPVSFVASSAGPEVVAVTNSGALYNPRAAQVNVFAAASGTARTFAASLPGTAPDRRTINRRTFSGAPRGFPSSFTRGWAPVPINITALSGSTSGVWARLYAAVGASASVGSGTELTSGPVQVWGALGATGTISPALPGTIGFCYLDLATDAAFTNPIRVAQRLRVGCVVGLMTRSQETGLARDYAGAGSGYPTVACDDTATWLAFDHRYSITDCGWFQQDGGTDPYQYHYGEATSAGPREFGRLLEAQLGVGVAITGVSDTGGGLDVFFNHDGALISGFDATVQASCGGDFRYLWVAMGGWDGADGAYPNETFAESRARMLGAVDRIAKAYPACAVIGWVAAASGWFGTNGSSDVGYTRLQNVVLNEMETSNRMVASKESTLWNEFYSGHATQVARLDYIRPGVRLLMAADRAEMGGYGTDDRGPRLTGAATINGRVISLPYALHGGTALRAVRATYTNPTVTYGTPSAAELASLFAVYAGAGGRNGTGQAIRLSGAAINASAGTVELTLAGTSGLTYADDSTAALPSALNVHYAADFGVSSTAAGPQYVAGGAGLGVSLCDDRTDLGIPYGWLMRPALDIAVTA